MNAWDFVDVTLERDGRRFDKDEKLKDRDRGVQRKL